MKFKTFAVKAHYSRPETFTVRARSKKEAKAATRAIIRNRGCDARWAHHWAVDLVDPDKPGS